MCVRLSVCVFKLWLYRSLLYVCDVLLVHKRGSVLQLIDQPAPKAMLMISDSSRTDKIIPLTVFSSLSTFCPYQTSDYSAMASLTGGLDEMKNSLANPGAGAELGASVSGPQSYSLVSGKLEVFQTPCWYTPT